MSTIDTPADTDTLSSFNPSTGELVGTVPVTPANQVDAVIARARAAQPAWAALSAQERADMLKPAGEALVAQAEALGRALPVHAAAQEDGHGSSAPHAGGSSVAFADASMDLARPLLTAALFA